MTDELKIKSLVVGEMQTNCYLLYNNKSLETLIIDPGDSADFICQVINDLNLKPIELIATHGHFDHILAINELQQSYSIPFAINQNDVFLVNNLKKSAEYFLKRKIFEFPPKINIQINDRDKISVGQEKIKVLFTPGHSPGSICLYSEKYNFLISGDTIFENGIGRTDFSYSSNKDMKLSLTKLLKLPLDTQVYSGHGESFQIKDFKKFAESDINLQ